MTSIHQSAADRIRERIAARIAQNQTGSAPPVPVLTVPAPPMPAAPLAPVIAANVWAPSPAPELGPVMPLAMVTYAQAAFWDNSEKPQTYRCEITGKTRKRKGPYHKLSLDLWTAPTDRIVKAYSGKAFIRHIQLRHPPQFEVAVLDKNLKSGKITEDYYREIRSILMTCDLNRDFLGVIIDRDTWTYHPHQFVHVRRSDDDRPVVDLYVNGECMTIDTFRNDDLSEAQHEKGVRFTAQFHPNA